MARLIIKLLGCDPAVYELHDDVVTVGRTAGNTIVVDNGTVSSRHAEIVRRANAFILRDLNSSNGSTVNGLPTTETVLKDNDAIGFGAVEATFAVEPVVAKVHEANFQIEPFDIKRKNGRKVFYRKDEAAKIVRKFTYVLNFFLGWVSGATLLCKLQAIRKKLQLVDLRSADTAIGMKALELKLRPEQLDGTISRIHQIDQQTSDRQYIAVLHPNSTRLDKFAHAFTQIKKSVWLEVNVVSRRILVTKLGRQIREEAIDLPELSVQTNTALEVQQCICKVNEQLRLLQGEIHPLPTKPWLIATGALALVLIANLAYRASHTTTAHPSHIVESARQQGSRIGPIHDGGLPTKLANESKRTNVGSYDNAPSEQGATTLATHMPTPAQKVRPSSEENDTVQQAWEVVVQLAKRSRTNLGQPQFWFDEKTGKIGVSLHSYNYDPLVAEVLLGDIDSINVRLIPHVTGSGLYSGPGYSVGLSTAEDCKFVSTHFHNNDVNVNGFSLIFVSEADAEKVASILERLRKDYKKRGLCTPIPKLAGTPLLEMLLNKGTEYPPSAVTVEGETLTISQSTGTYHLTKLVKISDLDPNHFVWKTTGERPTTVRLLCRPDKFARIEGSLTDTKYASSVDVVVVNERDANRVAHIVTDLCAARGWKSDGL